MTAWHRVAGDANDTIVAYLYGVTGTIASSESHVWAQSGTPTTLTAATVAGTDPSGTACLVHTIQLGTWLSGLVITTRTAFYLEHEVTFSDGKVLTWPPEQPDTVIARPAGD